MVLPRGPVALFYGFLYGFAGAVLVGVVTYLSIVTPAQVSPQPGDTGDSRLFLQCGLTLLPFGLVVASGWLAWRHTGMLRASALCGAVAGISYDVTYVIMIGAAQLHVSQTTPHSVYTSFNLIAGLRFARDHLLPENLRYLVLAATAGAILGALGRCMGKRRPHKNASGADQLGGR